MSIPQTKRLPTQKRLRARRRKAGSASGFNSSQLNCLASKALRLLLDASCSKVPEVDTHNPGTYQTLSDRTVSIDMSIYRKSETVYGSVYVRPRSSSSGALLTADLNEHQSHLEPTKDCPWRLRYRVHLGNCEATNCC